MGKVSLFLIVIGLVFLVPGIILTIIALFFPLFTPNQSNWLGIVIVFVIGLLFAIGFAFLILGLIITKLDKE